MQKKLTAFWTVFLPIIVLTVSASAAAPHFEDVSADTPFADSILYLGTAGLPTERTAICFHLMRQL